jgi:hypothetical protein
MACGAAGSADPGRLNRRRDGRTEDRAADAIESGRRRVERVLRDLAPAVRRSVVEARGVFRRSLRRVSRRAQD